MRDLAAIRQHPGTILVLGNHRPIVQTTLDFDFLSGKTEPSIVGIVTAAARFQKYFWGQSEVLIPCYATLTDAVQARPQVDWMLNVNSGRRAYQTTVDFFTTYPEAFGGHIFAEDVPEIHALRLYHDYGQAGKTIVGTAGVGLIVPGSLKLGAIGGVDWRQIEHNRLTEPGSVAVLSASGGMVNELITMVAQSGHNLSFALCFGGDRFPVTSPREAFLAAEHDPATETIVYYGELGGQDEYDIAELVISGHVTKPIIAYIAGIIGEKFAAPIQFGHAKALAGSKSETASAKRAALREAGVTVAESIGELRQQIQQLPLASAVASPSEGSAFPAEVGIRKMVTSGPTAPSEGERHHTSGSDRDKDFSTRRPTRFTTTIAAETTAGYEFVGQSLQDWATTGDIASVIAAALLGRPAHSKLTSDFIRDVFLLSADHGPQVSGALNTIVTARAGKGLVDSVAAGLLTIGPRFGGAVSDAAREWFDGVNQSRNPAKHIESYAKAKKYIGGIGHKKYRVGLPDPRTARLAKYADQLDTHAYYDYAKSIEAITTQKKGSLILNVDGHIAALMLDILTSEEGYTPAELDRLISADFFNALFVIPRIVGFTAHYLDQKRLDEGLFRLPDDDILLA